MEVLIAHNKLIKDSWLWLAFGIIPTIGFFLTIFVIIIKCYYSKLT